MEERGVSRLLGRFLGKLLKRGGPGSRKKEAEISATALPDGGGSGWCGNEEEGAGRQFSRMGMLPAEAWWPSAEVRLQRRITLVNAAFLLVTTAWFAGADPAPAATAAPAATSAGAVSSTPLTGAVSSGALGTSGCCGGAYSGGGYGGGCGCQNECCCRQSCLQRLKARFHNNCCCETCNTCGGNLGGNVGCCGSNYGGNVGGCGGNVGCCGGNYGGNVGCGNACCEQTCCRQGLCARLKARMHRNNCCCETCCDSGCGSGYGAGVGGVGGVGGIGGVPGVMPGTSAEPIKNLPKDATPGNKLPSTNKSGGTVQSNGLGLSPAGSASVFETEKNPF